MNVVCIYAYVGIYSVCLFMYAYIIVCMYVCMYGRMHVKSTHIYRYMYMYMYMYVHICIGVNECMHVRMFVFLFLHMYVHLESRAYLDLQAVSAVTSMSKYLAPACFSQALLSSLMTGLRISTPKPCVASEGAPTRILLQPSCFNASLCRST